MLVGFHGAWKYKNNKHEDVYGKEQQNKRRKNKRKLFKLDSLFAFIPFNMLPLWILQKHTTII